jgi:hypothetical protein
MIMKKLPSTALHIVCLTVFAALLGGTLASGAATPPLVFLDLTQSRAQVEGHPDDPAILRRHYDEVLLATCVQGLVNRTESQLFVRYNAAPDDFWFQKMTEAGGWMAGRKIERIDSVEELLKRFPAAAKGLVVWDERVPATMNVAATVAGVEDLLAVRFDEHDGSLYRELTSGNAPLKIVRKLLGDDGRPLFTGKGRIPGTSRTSTGSAKNDAYVWLIENYLKPGKTNPRMLGYYIDGFWLKCGKISGLQNHTLNNLDYLIANRAAIVDLNVWEDEATVDDPAQAPGTDVKTFREILMACVNGTRQKEMIAIFGFPPWAFKYTDFKSKDWSAGGKHGGVETEWKFAEVMTAYNAYMDADALGYSSFPNASFYQHYPVPAVVKQDATPTREKLIQEGVLDALGHLLPVNYYAFYQGDFDSAAWIYWHFPKIWNDPARGTLPLTWAINPTLAQRFPFGMHYLRKTSKPHEVFVAGEGAGYLNHSLLQSPRPEPGLPDALDLWVAHSLKWYQQWDLSVTGFNIDGNTAAMTDRGFSAYQKFSPGGIGLQRAPSTFGMRGSLSYLQMRTDLPSNDGKPVDEQTVNAVRSFFDLETPNFVLVRSILQTPSYYAEMQKRLQVPGNLPNKLVDMPTLLWLVREFESDPRYKKAVTETFEDKKSVSATPEARHGLRPCVVADGSATIEKANGQSMWCVAGGTACYLYFDVANDFAKPIAGGGVRIRVTYLDANPGTLGLQYDSTDPAATMAGAYKDAKRVTTAGTGRVATAEFELPDACFSGRQNGSSDFRLEAAGKPMRILSVTVEKY